MISDIVHPENNKAIFLSEAVHNIISHQEQYADQRPIIALGIDNFDNWVHPGKYIKHDFYFFSFTYNYGMFLSCNLVDILVLLIKNPK